MTTRHWDQENSDYTKVKGKTLFPWRSLAWAERITSAGVCLVGEFFCREFKCLKGMQGLGCDFMNRSLSPSHCAVPLTHSIQTSSPMPKYSGFFCLFFSKKIKFAPSSDNMSGMKWEEIYSEILVGNNIHHSSNLILPDCSQTLQVLPRWYLTCLIDLM